MGIEDYEPRVVQQLLDFTHRYVTDVLHDADNFGIQANNPPGSVAHDDIMLAIQARQMYSFVQPPGQALLSEVADEINKPPFPVTDIKVKSGFRCPPDGDRLTGANYQYRVSAAEAAKHGKH